MPPTMHPGRTVRSRALRSDIEALVSAGIADFSRVCHKTQTQRNRRWTLFSDFCTRVIGDIDAERVFIDLCSNQPVAKAICQRFLSWHVDNTSEVDPLYLENDEAARESRSVNSASTVDVLWKDLVGHANAYVLKKKRDEDPNEAWRWTLKYTGVKQGKLCDPVSQITTWIAETLAPEMGLTHHQTFVKREATAEDIFLILSTLWQPHSDIRILPRTRLAFHSAILLASIGGFRMSIVAEVAYRQVEVALVRVSGIPRLVATITLQQNKRQELTIRKSQDEFTSLSVTFVPCQTFCLLSFLLAQALADDAFEVHFESADMLLDRPKLKDNVDYMPLKWKADMLDKPILPLTYDRYWRTWRDTLHAAGCREEIRPYATRVGAGRRVDAVLNPAVRNYILSNTNTTFERNYLPRQIRADLMSISFGEAGTGQDSDALFSRLQQACLRRDEAAPVSLSAEEAHTIENYPEVQKARAALNDARAEESRDSARIRRLSSRLVHVTNKIRVALLKRKREAYFQRTDQLGALGQATGTSSGDQEGSSIMSTGRFRKDMGGLGTELVSKFLHQSKLGGERRTLSFIQLLCEYISHRFTNMDILMRKILAEASGTQATALPPPPANSNDYRCLFGCPPLSARTKLTDHVERLHGVSFTTQFECPECCRLGYEPVLIVDVRQYCLHTRRVHGIFCSPVFRDEKRGLQLNDGSLKKYRKNPNVCCLLCQGEYCAGQGHSRHFDKRHRNLDFQEEFSCPACQRSGVKDEDIARIDSVDAWMRHTESVHYIDGQRGHRVEIGILPRLAPPVEGLALPDPQPVSAEEIISKDDMPLVKSVPRGMDDIPIEGITAVKDTTPMEDVPHVEAEPHVGKISQVEEVPHVEDVSMQDHQFSSVLSEATLGAADEDISVLPSPVLRVFEDTPSVYNLESASKDNLVANNPECQDDQLNLVLPEWLANPMAADEDMFMFPSPKWTFEDTPSFWNLEPASNDSPVINNPGWASEGIPMNTAFLGQQSCQHPIEPLIHWEYTGLECTAPHMQFENPGNTRTDVRGSEDTSLKHTQMEGIVSPSAVDEHGSVMAKFKVCESDEKRRALVACDDCRRRKRRCQPSHKPSHKTRLLVRCDDCRLKRIRCDPSHLKSRAAQFML